MYSLLVEIPLLLRTGIDSILSKISAIPHVEIVALERELSDAPLSRHNKLKNS